MQIARHLIAIVTGVLVFASGAFAQPILLPGHSGLPNGIPNPCVVSTVTSVQSGPWDQPSTWSGNRVPASGDRVLVSPGTLVQYVTISDEKPFCVAVGGALQFSTTTSTRLRVGTLIVLETGSLEIGTETQPVPAGVTAELFLAGLPFDPSADPEQFWGGLIGIGRVTMHGAVMDPTFVRLLAEPLAGQASLTVSAPLTGWRVGDEVVIPDTRELGATERFGSLVPQSERARIAAINGQELLLDRRLAFAHQGARNFTGAIELLPHIGNVSRNVTVRSDAPAGVRGHTLYTHHAQVDIRFVEFRDLGRTRVETGQIGRYPIHLHHLMGPHNPSNTGYQYRLIGNAVIDGYLWPLTVHNTHYGLIRGNVVAFGEGAGYVAEDGNESGNEWVQNFGMAIRGDVNPRSLNGRIGLGLLVAGLQSHRHGQRRVERLSRGPGSRGRRRLRFRLDTRVVCDDEDPALPGSRHRHDRSVSGRQHAAPACSTVREERGVRGDGDRTGHVVLRHRRIRVQRESAGNGHQGFHRLAPLGDGFLRLSHAPRHLRWLRDQE